MTLHFEKYHALGNDYLVIDDRAGRGLEGDVVRRVCDRSRGVGSDGILLRGPDPEDGSFRLRVLNPDGSEAEKSGNGLRIFARHLFDAGAVGREPFRVRTAGGDTWCRVLDDGGSVRVEMGRVEFETLLEEIRVGDEVLVCSAVSIGNPHCVVFRDELLEEDLLRLGPLLETHPRFPGRTNVQFARPLDRTTLALEIWERGAGHTLASGSSSCAAAAVAHRLGLCDEKLRVVMPGGDLLVEIEDDGSGRPALVQQGPVVRVASGEVQEEALG